MNSLLQIRKLLGVHRTVIGFIGLVLILFASFGSFFHNHGDDFFHTKQHADCPANIWAHVPLAIVLFFTLFIAGRVVTPLYCSYFSPFVPQVFLFHRSTRAPPQ